MNHSATAVCLDTRDNSFLLPALSTTVDGQNPPDDSIVILN